MFSYQASLSHWPLVIFESPGALAPEQIDQESFYREAERLLNRRERFALLHDLRGTLPMDASRRKKFTDFVREKDELLRLRLVAHAVVISSVFQKGLITAILWVVNSPCPMKVFNNRELAEEWLRSELRKENLL
jgi:hypothetical protein